MKKNLPIIRTLLGHNTLVDSVIKDLGLGAALLVQVLGEVADQVLSAGGGVRETGVGQGLTVGSKGVAFGTAEALDLLLFGDRVALLGE